MDKCENCIVAFEQYDVMQNGDDYHCDSYPLKRESQKITPNRTQIFFKEDLLYRLFKHCPDCGRKINWEKLNG